MCVGMCVCVCEGWVHVCVGGGCMCVWGVGACVWRCVEVGVWGGTH